MDVIYFQLQKVVVIVYILRNAKDLLMKKSQRLKNEKIFTKNFDL